MLLPVNASSAELQTSVRADNSIKLHPIGQILELRNKHEIVGSVFYSNGCYSSHHNFAKVYLESKRIYLFHFAKISDGYCTMALVHEKPSFFVKRLPPGQYSLLDGYSNALIRLLEVNFW